MNPSVTYKELQRQVLSAKIKTTKPKFTLELRPISNLDPKFYENRTISTKKKRYLPYSSTSIPSISLTGSSTARSDRERWRGPFPGPALSSP
jgi:hypothetical protein